MNAKKILKIAGLVLVVLIVVPLIIALFLPKDMHIVRQITINKPTPEVFQYASHLKNQPQYATWQEIDPQTKHDYQGEDGKVGFVDSWVSQNENVGTGQQKITKIIENQLLEVELAFKEPFEATSMGYMSTQAANANATVVKWGYKGEMPYPFNLMCLFYSEDEMGGKDFDKGLQNMKRILEAQP